MPPQYVRPYVKTNKHADAAACCEAVQRPGMRFVPVKGEAQQALLMLHRVHDQLIGQRTATINAPRGYLAEFGIVAAQQRRGLGELLVIVGDAEDRRLPPLARELTATLAAQLRALDGRIEELARRVRQVACAGASCARLLEVVTGAKSGARGCSTVGPASRIRAILRVAEATNWRAARLCPRFCPTYLEVPGIGPVSATALVATVPDARLFASGWHCTAWLGLSRGNTRVAARGACSASASGATAICAASWCTGRAVVGNRPRS